MRAGETFHSFYMLFVRTEAGEVGSLVVAGADGVVRADRRRPADPIERGPDILLDAKDARNMAKYLRVGWKSEQEIGGRGGCPVNGQWHGKLKDREVIRDPGWTCVDYRLCPPVLFSILLCDHMNSVLTVIYPIYRLT